MPIISLKEHGIATGLTEAEADQITNMGQILALQAGMSFSDSIQIQNNWQGKRVQDVPSTTITDALQIQNHGNYYALANGIPLSVAALLNTENQVKMFALTNDLSFSVTYGDIGAVQFLVAKGFDKTIAQQFTELCQAVIYSREPTQAVLDDVIQLPSTVNCKSYINTNKNLAASLSLTPTEVLYYDTLQISGYKCIGGTNGEYVCVEGVIY